MRIVAPKDLHRDTTREAPPYWRQRGRGRPPDLDIQTILAWADSHKEKTGEWPKGYSVPILDALGENWKTIDNCLRRGTRGLGPLGGSSLARLLAEYRGVRNVRALPPLTEEKILRWADAHRRRTGRLPYCKDGEVLDAPGEKWSNVDASLREGFRGLSGGSSLSQLLARHRGHRSTHNAPPLTVAKILRLADRHYRRFGKWPTQLAGKVIGARNESWAGLNIALQRGTRSLAGGSSLAKLLQEHRGVRNNKNPPSLTIQQVLEWADLHRLRTGNWPTASLGSVKDAPGETWRGINLALWQGLRGFRGGSSIARLLERHRGKRNPANLPRLTRKQIWKWARAFRRQTGHWPKTNSGRIRGTRETWKAVDLALRLGQRGLRGGSSLGMLIKNHRA